MSYYKTHSITFESSDIVLNLYRWLSSEPSTVETLPVTDDRTSKTLKWEYGNDKGEGMLVHSMSINVRATDDMVDYATTEDASYLEVVKSDGGVLATMQNISELTEIPLRDEDVSTITLSFSSAGFLDITMDDLVNIINDDDPYSMFPNGASDAGLVKIISEVLYRYLMRIGDGNAYIANYMRWVDPDETYDLSNDVGDEPYLHQWLHRVSIDISVYGDDFTLGQFVRDFCKAHAFIVAWSHSEQTVTIQDLGAFRGGYDPFSDDELQKNFHMRPYEVSFVPFYQYLHSLTDKTHPNPTYGESDFVFGEQFNRVSSRRSASEKYQVVRLYQADTDPLNQETSFRFAWDPALYGSVSTREITTNWANEHEGEGASNILAEDDTVKDYDSLGSRFIHEVHYYRMVDAGVGPRRTRARWAGLSYANTQFYLQAQCQDIILRGLVDPAFQIGVTGFLNNPKFHNIRSHLFRPSKGTYDLQEETTQLNMSAYGRYVPAWLWHWNARGAAP